MSAQAAYRLRLEPLAFGYPVVKVVVENVLKGPKMMKKELVFSALCLVLSAGAARAAR